MNQTSTGFEQHSSPAHTDRGGPPIGQAGARKRALDALGPYAYSAALALLLFGVLSLCRALFVAYFFDRVSHVDGFGWLFLHGLRIDSIVVCAVLVLPTLCSALGLSPGRWRTGFRVYFCLTVLVVFTMELMSVSFINEYDARPNRLFVENLVPGRELGATIWADYKFVLLGLGSALLVAAWASWRIAGSVLPQQRSWPRLGQIAASPFVGGLLVLGIRGTDHRPLNISSAFFSTDRLVNELALNSTYSAAYAAYRQRHESSPILLYGSMPEEEIVTRVRKHLAIPAGRFESREIPFLRRQCSSVTRKRPANVVVILEESMGADFVGCLGGTNTTPEFDALSTEGLLFRRMYSTGTRTVRGMEATVSGFLPTPGRSVVKLERSQRDFFTVASLLRRFGYATDFVYGGESHFDNMRAFLLGNGFQNVMDQTTFEDPKFRGTWGVCDEDLMREANACFVAHGDQPFMALILSTSNHSPFEFPDGRIDLYEQPKATRHNSVKYADHALGELFRMARQEKYFRDTIWVIVADHNLRTYGDDLIPIEKFHIPALILGPGVAPGAYEQIASQVDLLPTVLPLVGLEFEHPMLGRDVLSLPSGTAGRAVLQQFETNAFLLQDHVVVHQPNKRGQQFLLKEGGLTPMELDPELDRDALAHALAPWMLYSSSRHRLPR